MDYLKSEEEFNQLKQEHDIIFLFSANWCPDCRAIEPVLPEIEKKYNAYTFVYVDRDQFIDICISHDIFGIPSFLAYDKGEETGRFVSKAFKSQEEIEKFIDSLSK
ncbi:thioredoxin family protein [Saliterribacillus persicus]|uniref:Thiol-disulfide isomerase/thioredoxin n=1 Tax=Saliterribacillus persicus TaxID=930114 RepID=A0A368X8D4_9BACI|nr:thioredoxin family protein [Saliterribacillus persicus]RCW62667.1 thiol-disulfide isomerase/thioredoxin [Saliterribacillus persicus]